MCSLEEKGFFFRKIVFAGDVTSETAIQNICLDKLWIAFKRLSMQEAQIVRLLYFGQTTLKKAAEVLGCSWKAMSDRQQKVLQKLNQIIETD